MRRFLVGLLATIGTLTLLSLVALGGLAWWLTRPDGEALPSSMLLTLDLRRPILEGQPSIAATWLRSREEYYLLDLVQTLDRAARDPRVKGIYARLDESSRGFATTQEIRQAILRVRDAGKATVAFADSFGELSPANESYYLASAFERIALQPVGSLGLTGLSLEEPFARGLLEKLGIGFDVTRRSEYKTALDFAAEREPSAAHREMSEALLDSLDAQFRSGLEAGRPALAGRIDAVIDQGPYTGQAALDAGLVDRLDHEDVVLSELVRGQGLAGEGRARRVDLDDYAAEILPDADAAVPKIAVVHAVGPILRGTAEFDGQSAAADDVAAALSAAREDPELRAVLFRISSPGGSAVASETIGREVDRLKAAGKPVIVSMGDVAGSGGYWIAANADVILADPATLTGSIGVIAGKPVLQDLWAWLEVNWVTTARGANADFWSLNEPYAPAEQAKVDEALDAIYGAFKGRVALARGMAPAAVEEVARGRVWTGEQALPIGLVDQIGGLAEAIGVAKQKIGLRPEQEVALVVLPNPDEGISRFLGRLSRGLIDTGTSIERLVGVLVAGAGTVGMSPPSIR